ncbi:hypothetical protein PCASD_17602 [Puccinia coronata f. sp. avenae]|uniref:Ras-GAP domain-containing protein n=1 Tax=Puccinia coronata f. sp. avenae TaxID=200324 RepID=A0A2N5TV74_9BASI|nr:hypothetical protein PCASD_17602 [Puccinia coronata f. sp. avenae]
MAVGELGRFLELLIRIYEANNQLFLRFSQLAAIEISGNLSTASILFRANTLLIKMLEAYMRIVRRSFLELSVGPVIRRICMTKVELEINPAKLKSSLVPSEGENDQRERQELKKVANEIWQSIYINRSRCPTPLRKIFGKIHGLVGDAYNDQDMQLTLISALIFLRLSVPAILNPRLFNLPEWTSNEYKGYGSPYALRASLPASSCDGIPTLPHLLDPHLEEEAPKTTPKFAKQLGARS